MNFFVSTNPRTGETIGTYTVCDEQIVQAAVKSACEKQVAWGTEINYRLKCIERLSTYIIEEAECIATVISEEIGKPIQEAYGAEILPVIKAIKWLLKTGNRHLRTKQVEHIRNVYQTPVPLGVVGLIGTWNYPVLLDVIPMLWALAGGNAVVWKPSPLATKCAMVMMKLIRKANLPVEMITGDASTGAILCRSEINKLAFTGSVATGRAILRELAKNGIPSVMELSGNDAMIICEDADIEEASSAAVWARCSNAGQSCVAPQRVYVASSVVDNFVQSCKTKMMALRPDFDYGPLRNIESTSRMEELLSEAVEQGACLVLGGEHKKGGEGCWRQPVLLNNCTDTMRVMCEDLFAPVIAVSAFNEIGVVEDQINQSTLALSASIWTSNLVAGKAIATRLRVGMVGINQEVMMMAADCRIPFGGIRGSGFGTVHGSRGLDEWVKWKVISVQYTGKTCRHRFPYSPLTIPLLTALVKWSTMKGVRHKLSSGTAILKAVMKWRKPEHTEI